MTQNLNKDQIDRIVHVKIHPGIGIARVGNSKTDFLISPEVTHPVSTLFGSSRDVTGALKRQVARFRVYGYDEFGNVVAEIQNSEQSTIQWRVHVANKKASWYRFDAAMDIPDTVNLSTPLRNKAIKKSERSALVIDPGEVSIAGNDVKGTTFNLEGKFFETSVLLGELRTDEVGRLLFFPGFGIGASPTNKPIYSEEDAMSFNNADEWFDDIADGPVKARVVIGDKEMDADQAWVVSAPPNYAPDILGWRTLDDLLRTTYIENGSLPVPDQISFDKDVKPILIRLSQLQWVNKGYLGMFGTEGPMNFEDKTLLKKLSEKPDAGMLDDTYSELRRIIYFNFRATDALSVEEGAWPWNYGDAFGYTEPKINEPPSPNTFQKLPSFYDYVLKRWVHGDFINDYQENEITNTPFENINLSDQPEMLDRAAMHFCLADAFHPGAELTWPMRHASLYRAPYRIRNKENGMTPLQYGAEMTNVDVMKIGGPLYEQGPGDLTKWMAIPWHGDTAYCRSGYEPEYDPYLPTFWPARVPNHVLTEENYKILCDTSLEIKKRVAAFHNREHWLREVILQGKATKQMLFMVSNFGKLGVLETKPRPSDLTWLPEKLYVENILPETKELVKNFLNARHLESHANDPEKSALIKAGWLDEEQLNEFLNIKRRGLR
jgi:hypothetical protein